VIPVDEGTVGILVFAALAVSVSFVWHRHIRSFGAAVLVSGPVAAILFQVVAALHIGYVDPFFVIALLTTTMIGWLVSCIVGYTLRRARTMVPRRPRPRIK
jgi:hypothetical protein